MKQNDTTSVMIGITSFFARGVFAIYWAVITNISSFELPAWRAFSSAIFVGLIVFLMKDAIQVVRAIKNKKIMLTLLASGLMIGINWALYIYAVTTGKISETSMGYYISPLINVAFSALIFKVRMNKYQVIAISLACIGVAHLFVEYGTISYLALSIAITFSLYGLLRKVVQIGSLPGLFIESVYLCVPASIYLFYLSFNNNITIINALPLEITLVVFCGLVTALPLAGFAYVAKKLSLATVGILQYLTPTVSLFIGIFMYNEPFTMSHFITFSFIWIGLIIYSIDGLISYKKSQKLTS